MKNSHPVGIVIVTHGASGRGLLVSVTELLGAEATTAMHVVEVPFGEDRPATLRRVHEAVDEVDGGHGVLILCDLVGSTPANCCLDEMRSGDSRNIHVLTGISMPMLIKVATIDRVEHSVDTVAEAARETAVNAVKHLGGN